MKELNTSKLLYQQQKNLTQGYSLALYRQFPKQSKNVKIIKH